MVRPEIPVRSCRKQYGRSQRQRWLVRESQVRIYFHITSAIFLIFYRITALEQLQDLTHAPSVAMHDVPRESVGAHLGFGKDEDEGRDELDEQLARMYFLLSPHYITETGTMQSMHDMYTIYKGLTHRQKNLTTILGILMNHLLAGDANLPGA